ncbi:MAG TPA: VOC family protein, partial [Myxococcales bacterium]|nr:VOC family protein [Myxococcales bacterium]
ERWYRDVLGLEPLRRWPGADGQERAVWLRLDGDAFLALERCDGEAPGPAGWERPTPGYFVLALRIAAADGPAWEARLAVHGVAVERRTQWTLFFRDLEGNRIGLSSHPEARSNDEKST